MDYIYIIGTLFFTVYGQLVLKWRISGLGQLPESFAEKILFLGAMLLDPWIFSGFVSAFIASMFWMGAMTKFDISYAYPFMSGAFVFVLLFSTILFNEPVTWQKIVGLILIVAGIFVSGRSL